MTKPKQPPKNFFRYFLDEYILFRHDFTIETTAGVEDCVYQLSQLSHERQGDWLSRHITVSFNNLLQLPKRYFVIYAKLQKQSNAQSASAQGSIEPLPDGTTLVNGKVLMFGWGYWFGVITIASVFLLPLLCAAINVQRAGTVRLVYFIFYGGIIIYCWLRMYRGRNYLLRQIQQAIRNAETESNLSKAKNEPISQPYDDSSEYQLQRKSES